MSNHYNFNINPDKLSKQQIERHQDFDALLQKYQTTPAPKARQANYRWLKLIGSTAAAACIGFAMYMSFFNTEESSYFNTAEAYFATQDFINPPFKNIKAQFAHYTVDANQGGIYKYKNGSQLVIPPAAFVNQGGDIVTGAVDIKYREFHDFVDFFISGIPMEYDSAGIKYNLESAGMIEIYAEQNGQRLNMHPGKNIDVELISEINAPRLNVPPNYNVYKLDTLQRKWLYKAPDKIAFLVANKPITENQEQLLLQQKLARQLQNIQEKYETELAKIEATIPMPSKPIKPIKTNPNNHPFNLNFEIDDMMPIEIEEDTVIGERERAHLKALKKRYGNIYWQTALNSPPIEESVKKTVWEDFQIKALNEKDFELTLIQGSRKVKVIVNPALSESDFEKEMANYQKVYALYERLLAERNAQLDTPKQLLKESIAQEKSLTQKTFEEQIAQLKTKSNTQFVSQKVINKFKATSFGIWNCDRPVLPASAKVSGSIIDNSHKKHQHRTAFLADKTKNTISRFYVQKDCQVNYNQDADNLLWLVTTDKKIAVFRPEKFKRINQSKDDFTFSVKVIDKEIKSEKDVRDILKFEL